MEIQIVLCILSLYSVLGQDGVNLGGNIMVQDPDPFADPGVDPFGTTVSDTGMILPDRNTTDAVGFDAQGDPMVPGANFPGTDMAGITDPATGSGTGTGVGPFTTPDPLVDPTTTVSLMTGTMAVTETTLPVTDPTTSFVDPGAAPGGVVDVPVDTSITGPPDTSIPGSSGDIMSAGGADPFNQDPAVAGGDLRIPPVEGGGAGDIIPPGNAGVGGGDVGIPSGDPSLAGGDIGMRPGDASGPGGDVMIPNEPVIDQPAMIGGVVSSISRPDKIRTVDQGGMDQGGRTQVDRGTSVRTGSIVDTRTRTRITGQDQRTGTSRTQGQTGTVRRQGDSRTGTSSDRIVGGIGGGGFDRLALDRGPCFDKCLRKRDTCLRPHNCTHYEHCYTSMETLCPCTLRPCPFGTLWSVDSEGCEIASKVFCEDDPCALDLNLLAYTSGINCKSYYACSEGQVRRSLPMCCNDFHSFSLVELRCVPDESCGRIPCTVQSSLYDADMFGTTTSEPLRVVCPLMADRSNPALYNHKTYRLMKPMQCAAGTVFDETICTCVNTISLGAPPVLRPCEEIVFIDFAGSILLNHKIGIPVYPTDTQTVTTKEGAKYGRFNGKTSVIEIPYFDGKPVKNFLARIRFYTDGKKGPDNQVLLSNCQSARVDWDNPRALQEATLSPSLAIILNRKQNMLTFLGSTGETGAPPVVMQLPFKPNDWNNVELMYDGRNLQARNRVLTASADAGRVTEEDIKPLEGYLGTFREPLKIGACDQNDGFYGYMDMIKIFECIPRRG